MSRDPQDVSFSDNPRRTTDADPLNRELDLRYWISVAFRSAGQLLGVVLLLIGVYYSLSTLTHVLAASGDPKVLEAQVESFTKLLDLQDAQVTIDNKPIALGKAAGFGALVLWYALTFWIPLALLTAGSKLIWGPISERRAFYNAIEEFFRTARVNDIKK